MELKAERIRSSSETLVGSVTAQDKNSPSSSLLGLVV